jgi:hypothetical protein
MQKSLRFGAIPYICIVVGVLALFQLVSQFPPMRVGDGAEYYGLYYAWEVAHRPWMSAPAYDAYAALFGSGDIIGLVTRDQLASAFDKLRVGATSDFNHFWFYSLLAFVCGKAAALIGIKLSVHGCFLALHSLALTGTAALAYRHYRWRGVLAVALMLLVSPLLWFIDKVHTEFLTICLVLASVILLSAQRYLGAALLIALASTQNPSFALVACIPLFYRVVLQREQPYSFGEMALAMLVVLAVLAHPVYYFSRYGVVTPQLLAGGAAMGSNLSSFYVWIVDPDVGLLPNWPLGCAILLVLAVAFASRKAGSRLLDKRWMGFALLYLAINFYAHSSTVNLNSGATPGLARYALWYLPLAFPLFLRVFDLFPVGSKRFYAALAALAGLAVLSVETNDPRKPEQFSAGSLSSRFIQTHLPGLYNPPYEIFVERYSGIGEGVGAGNYRAVFGPDCRKMIVIPGGGRANATSPADCMFDQAKVDAWVNASPLVAQLAATLQAPGYARMPEEAAVSLGKIIPLGEHRVGANADGGVILGTGWSGREDWGTWSERSQATLLLPCRVPGATAPANAITVMLRLRPFQKQSISILSEGKTVWQGPITLGDQEVHFEVKPASCERGLLSILIDIPTAVSPMKLGMSGDARELGVGLSSYVITLR